MEFVSFDGAVIGSRAGLSGMSPEILGTDIVTFTFMIGIFGSLCAQKKILRHKFPDFRIALVLD